MVKKAALTLLAVALSAACQLPGPRPACVAAIDWVDFVQVGGTLYVAAPGSEATDADLGPVLARVKFKVSGNVCDPGYRIKDGDAAFLEPGTAVQLVNGHAATEEVAARHDGRLVVYAPMPPPASPPTG